METVSGDNWSYETCKLQSEYHHQQTNTQFFLHAGCPSCRPTKSVKALKGKIVTIQQIPDNTSCHAQYGSTPHLNVTLELP